MTENLFLKCWCATWRKFQRRFLPETIHLFEIIFLSETWHKGDSADKMWYYMDTFIKTYTEKIKKGKEGHPGGILVYYIKELKYLDILWKIVWKYWLYIGYMH